MFFWKKNFPVAITCSKTVIEVLEQGMKYVRSQEERPQSNIIDVVLELKCYLQTCFTPYSIVLIVDFGQFSVLLLNKITRTVKTINFTLIESSISFH